MLNNGKITWSITISKIIRITKIDVAKNSKIIIINNNNFKKYTWIINPIKKTIETINIETKYNVNKVKERDKRSTRKIIRTN
jgi:hypothetical protein